MKFHESIAFLVRKYKINNSICAQWKAVISNLPLVEYGLPIV